MRSLIGIALLLVFIRPALAAEVFTSNYPLYYLTSEITTDNIDVYFPEIEGDPAFWQPSVEEIAKMQGADLIILNGATYEKWRPYISLPGRRIVDTSKSFESNWITLEQTVSHQHGPEGKHKHDGISFTTWLDFDLLAQQVKTIAEALEKKGWLDEAKYQGLLRKLSALNASVLDWQNQPIIASHPVYDYFARRYQINLESVVWEPDAYPDDESWQSLKNLLERHPAQWMIWEGEPLPKTKERLQQMGVQIVVFDPVGNAPETGDFMSVMEDNIKQLQSVLFKDDYS